MDIVGKIKDYEKQITYTWTIDDFCDVRKKYASGQAVFSPVFYTDIRCKWQLKLWPQGSTEDDKEFISLYVYYLSKSTVKALITFSVIDNKTEISKKVTDPRHLFEEGKTWGYSKYLNSNDICTRLRVGDNKLIIKCKVELDDKSCIGMHRNDTEMDLRTHDYDKFEELLDNNKFSDVTINVNDKKIRAHKCILAAKSAVFAAMFEHDMEEKKCNVVEIQDIAPGVLKEMLRYIYVGRVDDIVDIASDLLVAADKYLLKTLKNMCEETLCDDLSPSNAIEYLMFAENHNASKLKAEATQYIVSNPEEIIEDSKFELYAELQSDLICEVFRDMVIQKVIKTKKSQ